MPSSDWRSISRLNKIRIQAVRVYACRVCLSVYEPRELFCKSRVVDYFLFQSRFPVKLRLFNFVACHMSNIDACSIGEFNFPISFHLPRFGSLQPPRRGSNRHGRSGSLIFSESTALSNGRLWRKEHASCRALARKISLERVLAPISINQSDGARSGARHTSNRSPFRSFISRWAASALFPP